MQLIAKNQLKCNGISLIEVMISLFIFSILMFGMESVTFKSLQQAKSTYYFNVATQQINNMIERLRVIKAGNWEIAQENWNKENQNILPQGRGMIEGQYPNYVISIFWGQMNSSPCLQKKIGLSGCLSRNVIII